MANTIQIKRRTSAPGNQAGAPSSLVLSELAFNEVDSTLYIGRSTAGSTPITVAAVGGSGAFLALTGTQTAAGSYTFNTGTVTLDGTVTGTGINNYVLAKRLNEFTVPNANVAFNSQRITGLADPTDAQDAATKAYVDAARSGLDVKASVRAATTANITLSGTQTIDGVVLVAGDRVLVKNQNTASQNGIYVVAAGAWARATDADTNAEVTSGLFTFVEDGTVNADSGWVLSTTNPITVGTTSLTFNKFSGAGQIEAGAGLTKGGTQGNTIDVGTANTGRIVVNADNIDLATTGVTAAASYTRVTVDAYGRVTAADSPLVVAAGKVLTASNTLTFTGTDASSVAFGVGGTVVYAGSNNAFTGANTFVSTTGQTFRPAATQDGIVLLGRAGGTNSRAVTVATAELTASRTVTLPNADGTVLLDSTVCAAITGCTIDGGTF
jgi:phage-related tail fiber protein